MWQAKFSRAFLKDLAGLPKQMRERIETVVFGQEILEDPFRGDVKPMVGNPGFYRLRIGDYRVGMFLDIKAHVIEFRRVRHRREAYRRFP